MTDEELEVLNTPEFKLMVHKSALLESAPNWTAEEKPILKDLVGRIVSTDQTASFLKPYEVSMIVDAINVRMSHARRVIERLGGVEAEALKGFFCDAIDEYLKGRNNG